MRSLRDCDQIRARARRLVGSKIEFKWLSGRFGFFIMRSVLLSGFIMRVVYGRVLGSGMMFLEYCVFGFLNFFFECYCGSLKI